MTNYNDGNWIGWNGGECPIHPKSKVEVVVRDPDGFTRSNAGTAESFRWEHLVDCANIIAFSVVKEHREPREWWIVNGIAYPRGHRPLIGGEVVHVREVLE